MLDEIPKTASEKPQDRFLVEALRAPGAEVYAYRKGAAERVATDAFTAADNRRPAGMATARPKKARAEAISGERP